MAIKEKNYQELVKKHHPGIYRMIYLCFPEKEVANKIIKQTFYNLWQNAENLEGAKAKAWLFSAAYRSLLEHLRKIGSYGQAPEEFIFNDYSNSSEFNFELIHQRFGSLTVKQKAIIILTDIEKFEFLDIAEMFYTDFTAIKTALFRARRKLKEEIKPSK
jgi:RNA polymerase sigma-70 factor (ECF subfamily)